MWLDEGPPEWFALKRRDIRRSLSGDLQVMREDLSRQTRLWETYKRLYIQFFGVQDERSWKGGANEKTREKLAAVYKVCSEKRYDTAVWIAAQMRGFQFVRIEAKKYDFQARRFPVTWLCGPKSESRYRRFVREGRQRVDAPVAESHDCHTPLGLLRTNLALAEEDVVEVFLRKYLREQVLDWSGAISEAEPNTAWKCIEFQGARTGDRTVDQTQEFRLDKVHSQVGGPDQLKEERHYARLKAAWAVANRMQSGLPDHIGFDGSWSWEEFVRLMGRLFPERVCEHDEEPDLSDVIGTVWGTHRRGRQKGTGTRGEKRKEGRRDIFR